MSLDHLFQKFGDVEFPAFDTDVTNTQLFSVFDPARDRLLALFRAAINQELGHGVDAVAATSPWYVARQGTNLSASLPVADTLYVAPTAEVIRETNVSFPLLALYRTSAEHEEFSLQIELERCTWGLDYILPPLGASELRRLAAVLSGVRKIVPLVVRRQGHAAYESGAVQFGTGVGGLSTLKVKSSQEGPASFSGQNGEGPVYYALHFDLESVELDSSTAVEADFEGVNMNLSVGGGDAGNLPDMIQFSTDVDSDP